MAKYARAVKDVFRIAKDTNRHHASAVAVMESSAFIASDQCVLLTVVVVVVVFSLSFLCAYICIDF